MAESTKKQILLVCQDQNLKEMVERVLENDPTTTVHYAYSGSEGLKMIQMMVYFDLIISEVNGSLRESPFIQGWIKNPNAWKTPLILITDAVDHTKLSNCREYGIRHVLVQPVAFDDLFAKLKSFGIIAIQVNAEVLERFRKISFFEFFSDEAMAAVIEQGYLRRSDEGIITIREGRTIKKLTIILSGKVGVYNVKNPVKPVLIAALGPGQILGEQAFLRDSKSVFRIRTEEACQFFNLPLFSLQNLKPPVRERLLRSMIGEMNSKLVAMNERLAG